MTAPQQARASMIDGHECVLLAALMNGTAELPVTAEDFSSPPNQKIFECITALPNRSLIAVTDALRRSGQLKNVGGNGRVTEISVLPHDPDSLNYALGEVLEQSRTRRARKVAERLLQGSITPTGAQRLLTKVIEETRQIGEPNWTDALSESVVTSRELGELELTPRKKLLGDWFCEGDCGFIFASRGVGKTWLALAIGQALSTGGKLGDWKAPESVRVLYVDGEMPPDLMRDRAQGLESSNDNLEFLNHLILFERTGRALNIARQEVQQALTAHAVAHNVNVLILDNLSTLASGMKENEADSWEQLNPWLLDLRRRKIAVVIVHHAGRSGEMRGTSKREDNVFWIIALEDLKKNAEDKRGARFVSHFTKPSRNTQQDVPACEWHFVTESDGTVSIAHKQAQSLDVFRNVIESGVTRCDEIADAMKLRPYVVSRMAKKAIDAGWLRKSGRGYALVEGKK
jgi:putative DNA primase/helicase